MMPTSSSSSSWTSSLSSAIESGSEASDTEDFLKALLPRFQNVFAPQPGTDDISEDASRNQENAHQEIGPGNEPIVCQLVQGENDVGEEIAGDEQELLLGEKTTEKSLGCCAVSQWFFGKYFRGF